MKIFIKTTIISLFVLFFSVISANAAQRALSGWAWSDTIGWIQFNPSYGGVFIDNATGVLSGSAWTDNAGWIDFRPGGAAPNGKSGAVTMNLSTGELTGWARDLSGADFNDGWDGWISMSGTSPNYGVGMDLNTGKFSGWAWGSDIVGWISFSGSGYGVSCLNCGSTSSLPQCSDGIDNDGDGLVDMNDPGCASPSDNSEANSLPQCSDGIDNDGDGLVDMNDPGCASPSDNNETDPVILPNFNLSNSNSIHATIISKGAAVSDETTITVVNVRKFSGSVSLSVTNINPPLSGATYNFSDATLSSSKYSTGSTFSVNVPSDTSSGLYTITVHGQGGGLSDDVTIKLNVESLNPTWKEI